MTQKETQLFAQEYDVGEPVIFALYRQQQEERVTVSLKYRFPSQGPEEITCRKIFYPLRAEDYESPYLSWYNLICCSNNYGPVPVVPYMNRAVQKGRKVAATIYPASAQEYMSILAEVEQKPDRYYCYPYHPQEYRYLLYTNTFPENNVCKQICHIPRKQHQVDQITCLYDPSTDSSQLPLHIFRIRFLGGRRYPAQYPKIHKCCRHPDSDRQNAVSPRRLREHLRDEKCTDAKQIIRHQPIHLASRYPVIF